MVTILSWPQCVKEKSALVLVMAWCRQAPSHYLSQCWPRFMTPYGVTSHQVTMSWVLSCICMGPELGHHWVNPHFGWSSCQAKWHSYITNFFISATYGIYVCQHLLTSKKCTYVPLSPGNIFLGRSVLTYGWRHFQMHLHENKIFAVWLKM